MKTLGSVRNSIYDPLPEEWDNPAPASRIVHRETDPVYSRVSWGVRELIEVELYGSGAFA